MKIIHFCAGLEGWNGMANTARQFVEEELTRGDESQLTNDVGVIERTATIDRVQIHGTWLPVLWKVAKLAKRKGAELIVRPCGNYDPIRIRRGAIKRLKKWLVGPFEHAMLNRADFVQCTCAAEAEWVKVYHPRARIQMTDLKRFFDLGVDGSRSRTEDGSLHVLYLGRRDPLKGVEFLERAVAEIQVKVRDAIERSEIAEGLREQRRVGISAGVEKDRRGLALRKIDEWLQGVDAESFDAALERLVGERSASSEYRFKKEDERETAIAGARRFFVEFARKIIELSDGRCVYFAPDKRALERNRGDRARCWAEYAFHAVSSSGKIIDGRNYRERLFNSIKLDAMAGICEIISQEHCMYRLIDAVPQNDAVIFIGKDAFGGRTEVVTRLDEYGNAKANLGEVTVIVQHKRNKQTPPPKFRPLTEVVETVAKHQAAGFSPSTTANSVANPIGPRKGAVREIGLGRRSRSTVEVELRIVSDHVGEELEKDWAWCDVLCLPTLSENFGRVVAEALERGKRVITTDGAPVWGEGELFDCSDCSDCSIGYGGRLVYLKGYRDGTDEERVRLLKEALEDDRLDVHLAAEPCQFKMPRLLLRGMGASKSCRMSDFGVSEGKDEVICWQWGKNAASSADGMPWRVV